MELIIVFELIILNSFRRPKPWILRFPYVIIDQILGPVSSINQSIVTLVRVESHFKGGVHLIHARNGAYPSFWERFGINLSLV